MLTTPVALFIFKRPSHTQQVFERIRDYKPSRLFVIADGPRNAGEAAQCMAARAVVEQVDWACDVVTNFSGINLGCNSRIQSGLDWVFQHCDEAIILEDDCLPHPSFFDYCSELLNTYRDDSRIMAINGLNLLSGRRFTPYSYYFSRYAHSWGWATWRRAWSHFDAKLSLWPELRDTAWLQDMLGNKDAVAMWRIILDSAFAGATTWDHAWIFACWVQHGLAIAPNVNLISNIGYDEQGTTTTDPAHHSANLPTAEMIFPLRHDPPQRRRRLRIPARHAV